MVNKNHSKQIIENVAHRLDVPPAWLDALINFETGGTYDPTVKNPYSSARGLIQVLDSTAQDVFNVSDSLSLVREYDTFESQMENVVYPYLKRYAPFNTQQELYMAVFYPAYRYENPDTAFPKHVQAANPGIFTIQDYIDFVNRRINPGTMHFPFHVVPWAIFLVGGVAILYFLNRGPSL